jgi:hypothetical protein
VFPMGKNNSGSSSRQAAWWRQSMRVTPLICLVCVLCVGGEAKTTSTL